MGLDSYLNKERRYRGKVKIIFDKGTEEVDSPTVATEVAYWRKANQIHKWFIDHCNDGHETDEHVLVFREDLEKLLETCKKVKDSIELVEDGTFKAHVFDESGGLVEKEFTRLSVKDPTVAKKLLPTQAGFFFGSTDYDSVYLDDVEDTIKQLTEILKEPEDPDTDYYYEASW